MKVALLGTGAMGSRIAKRMKGAGHTVVLYNRTTERTRMLEAEGMAVCGSPREAAASADLVMSVVRDVVASREVWLGPAGAIQALRPEAIAVESSTVSPGWIAELAAAVRGRGAALLDAPVVGSRPQADAGSLIYLVGGALETLERARPSFAAAAAAVHHVGPLGSGTLAKLATNALFASQVAGLAEVFRMLEHFGLDRTGAAELFAQLPVLSASLKGVSVQMAARSFAPLFPIELALKDLRYFLEAAHSVGMSTPSAAAAAATYETAVHDGLGAQHVSALVELSRARPGGHGQT